MTIDYSKVDSSSLYCSLFKSPDSVDLLSLFPMPDAPHGEYTCSEVRSVPPRGSGWVFGFSFSIANWFIARCQSKSAIDNPEIHPLPRGGTDFMPPCG